MGYRIFLTFPLNRVLIVIIAFLLDFIFGDPRSSFHPIVIIGNFIKFLEKRLLKGSHSKSKKKRNGFIMVAVVSVLAFAITFLIIFCSFKLNIFLGNIISAVFLFFMICNGSIISHSKRITGSIEGKNLKKSREEVGKVVGRSTGHLGFGELMRASVESIAENTSDGLIAPLFYYLIGGVPLVVLYKSVNTLDSIIGYKNRRYFDFGYFSAKFDDILNFLPARLTAVVSGILSFVVGGKVKETFSVIKKYSSRHESPNSGYPEAAFAGALGLKFGGTNYYFGTKKTSKYIGIKKKDFKVEDIGRALKLSILTSILFMFLVIILYLVFSYIWYF
ncbi:MAG: adenosylcobinamide-phosphate synthase CbiB [Actinobacteria bacterium]|nr:adenosylcobinamide-phosphate synthase CbiB [Actinomycetota bacterium]